jgi:putative acetyltransferase
MQIRPEAEADVAAIQAVNESAFETPAEAGLVAVLRAQARPVVSLVAEVEGATVGHILFSPVVLSGHPELEVMGLAPMAVEPELPPVRLHAFDTFRIRLPVRSAGRGLHGSRTRAGLLE